MRTNDVGRPGGQGGGPSAAAPGVATWDALSRPAALVGRTDALSRALLANAGSMVGAMAVTSALGYLFWTLAARQFSPAAVGLAAAAVSAMLLLGTVGMLGLGTLLIGELPRHQGREGRLIATALLLAATAGGALGATFALAAPLLSAELAPLAAGGGNVALFALGVALTAATLVLDQALVGLLRGELQLARNACFALAKLGALALAVAWSTDGSGLEIYATWVLGNLVSLAGLAWLLARRGSWAGAFRPDWRLLRGVQRSALGHHALNLALQAPALAMPVLVTAMLSTAMNAYFYVAWMLAGFVFVGPLALTTAVYAVGARAPSELGRKLRFSLVLCLGAGVLANGALLFGADLLLGLFGGAYAEQAGWSVRLLALGVFPATVKYHYLAVCRVEGRLARAAALTAAGGALELLLAAIGTSLAGLPGLSLGWLVAAWLEAGFMARPVLAGMRLEDGGWRRSPSNLQPLTSNPMGAARLVAVEQSVGEVSGWR